MRPKAAIIDLDGTLADSRHRVRFLTGDGVIKSPAVWRAETDKDVPVEWCVALVAGLRAAGYKIIYLTGREDTTREATRSWLSGYIPKFYDDTLLMRKAGDNRGDVEIKEEIYLEKILPEWRVELAVDDRAPIATLWRKYGITCLHCAHWEEDQAKLTAVHKTFQDEIDARK